MDFRALWVILKREVKTSLKVSRAGRRESMFTGLLWLLCSGIAAAVFYGSYRLFSYLGSSLVDFPGLRNAIDFTLLDGVAIFSFIVIFLADLQLLYRMIYESADLPFLLSQPIDVGTVFAAKFLGVYVQVLLTNLLFIGPVWVAYGVVRRATALYYSVALTGIALATLLACSAVSLMIVVVMGLIPGRRMKQISIAAGAGFGLILVLVSQVASRELAQANIIESLKGMSSTPLKELWYLPSTWLVNMALGVLPSFGMKPWPAASALVITSVGFTWLTVVVARRQFLRGWSSASEEHVRERRARANRPAGVRRRRARGFLWGNLQGGTWALLKKDLVLMLREPTVWYELLVTGIVLVFFVLNMRGNAADDRRALATLRGLALVMPAFMATMAVGMVGGMPLSLEASRFWLLACQPYKGQEVFKAKLACTVIPGTALALVYVLGIGTVGGLPMYPFWMCVLVVLAIMVTVSAFQMLLDSLFPDFTLRIGFGETKTSGRSAGKFLMNIFSSMVLVAVMAFVVFLPAYDWATRRLGPNTPLVATAILLLLAAGTFILARSVVSSKIDGYLTNWSPGPGS